jgi:peroxiredoxin
MTIAPDTLENARHYFRKEDFPFLGLVDETHAVFDLYDVQDRLTSLGQRPALFIIDTEGIIRYAFLGTQQWQIPSNSEVLIALEAL